MEVESLQHDGFQFLPKSTEHFEYDAEGRETEWSNLDATGFGLSRRRVTTYGGDGTIEQVNQVLVGENWEDNFRYLTETDGAGRPVQELGQSPDGMGGWQDSIIDHFTYNDVAGWARVESYQMFEEDWLPMFAETTSYDQDGDPTVILSQSWPLQSTGWVDSHRVTFLFGSGVAAEGEGTMPSVAGLDVYPSPAADDVNIAVSRADAGVLRVEVFDLLGRQVAQLADRQEPA